MDTRGDNCVWYGAYVCVIFYAPAVERVAVGPPRKHTPPWLQIQRTVMAGPGENLELPAPNIGSAP